MAYVPGLVLRTARTGSRSARTRPGSCPSGSPTCWRPSTAWTWPRPGWTGFGRPDGYLERQLARWQRQWELSNTREMPGYAELTRRLTAALPAALAAAGRGTLVHGDYRLDNMLVTLGARPAIAAVLDWEMSTLGDPLADLGLALVYWAQRATRSPSS